MAKAISDQELKDLIYPGGRQKDIYRKLSYPLVKLILPWNIHPDLIQLFRLVFCIVGFGFFFTGNYILSIFGALLFHMNILFDTFDGAMARYQKKASVKGEYQDAALDHVTSSVIYFMSAAILAFIYLNDTFYLWMGAITALLAQVAAFLRAMYIEYKIPVVDAQKSSIMIGLAHQDNSRHIATILLIATLVARPDLAAWIFAVMVPFKIAVLSVHIFNKTGKSPFSLRILLRYFLLLTHIFFWLVEKITKISTFRIRAGLNKRSKMSVLERSIISRLK